MAWTDDVRPGKAAASAVGGAGAGYLLNKYLLGNDTTGSSILASALGAALGGGGSMLYDYFTGPSVSGSTDDVDKWNKYKRYARAYLGDREPDKDAKLKLSGKDLDKAMRELKRDVDSPTANNLLRAGAWGIGIPVATRLATEAASLYIPRDLDTITIKGSGKSIPVKTRGKMARHLFGVPTERTIDLAGVSDRDKMALLRDIAQGEQRINIAPNQRKEFIDAAQNLENARLADEAYNRRRARYDRARTALKSREVRNSRALETAKESFTERHSKWEQLVNRAKAEADQRFQEATERALKIKEKLSPEDQKLFKLPQKKDYQPIVTIDEPKFVKPALEKTRTLTPPKRMNVGSAPRRGFNELMNDLGRGANKMNKFRRLTLPRALGIVNGLSLLAGLGVAGAEHLSRRQRLSELASGVINR